MSGPDCKECGEHFLSCHCNGEEKPIWTYECPHCFLCFDGSEPANKDPNASFTQPPAKVCEWCEKQLMIFSSILEERLIKRRLEVMDKALARRLPETLRAVFYYLKGKSEDNA